MDSLKKNNNFNIRYNIYVDYRKNFFYRLSGNPNAIPLLEHNQHIINWKELSLNPNAINLLEQNQDKISWLGLSTNPNAIHLLEQNQDKIDWIELSYNPNAIHLIKNKFFNYDYEFMEQVCNIYKEELIAYVFHPCRLFKNVTEETDLGDIFNQWD